MNYCYLWRLVSAKLITGALVESSGGGGKGCEGRSQANEGLDRGCYPVSFWWDYCAKGYMMAGF